MTAVLVLEDGRTFRGRAYGAIGKTFGEAVFSTGMSGYQDTLTDPSFFGQVVVMTAPHIGNAGWQVTDDDSDRIWVAGLVVRDPSRMVSNWRIERSLEDELAAQNIVGICGIDTRALTRHLRDHGSLRAGIVSVAGEAKIDTDEVLREVLAHPRMSGTNLLSEVTTKAPYTLPAQHQKRCTVVALDLGIKAELPSELAKRGVEVTVVPANTSWDEIKSLEPDGVFLSDGPGDPAAAQPQVELTRQVLQAGIPILGVCFGHQILARALGFETYELDAGHRGINQPVLDRATGEIDFSPHEHGFAVAVDPEKPSQSPFGEVQVSHVCLDDDVVEGLEVRQGDQVVAMSVQYHPQAAAGPHAAQSLFDRYIELLAEEN